MVLEMISPMPVAPIPYDSLKLVGVSMRLFILFLCSDITKKNCGTMFSFIALP